MTRRKRGISSITPTPSPRCGAAEKLPDLFARIEEGRRLTEDPLQGLVAPRPDVAGAGELPQNHLRARGTRRVDELRRGVAGVRVLADEPRLDLRRRRAAAVRDPDRKTN